MKLNNLFNLYLKMDNVRKCEPAIGGVRKIFQIINEDLFQVLVKGVANLSCEKATSILKKYKSKIRAAAEKMYLSYYDVKLTYRMLNNEPIEKYLEFMREIYDDLENELLD